MLAGGRESISTGPQGGANAAGQAQAARVAKYTVTMNLKSAAFLALVGTLMLTVLLIAGFIFDVVNVLRGVIPAIRLLTSFIYAFAGLTAVVFLYAFHRAQS